MDSDALVLYMLYSCEKEERRPLVKSLPAEAISQEVAEEIIRLDSSCISAIPQERITYEMAKSAVENGPWVLHHIPSELLDEELCLNAVERKFAVNDIRDLPRHLYTSKFCRAAVTKEPYALLCLPEQCLNEELCLLAVDACPDMIFSIGEKFRTENLFIAAIRRNPEILTRINFRKRTSAMCFAAIESGKDCALQYLTPTQKTPNFLQKAVCINPDLWENIPKNLQTPELAEMALLHVLKHGLPKDGHIPGELCEAVPNQFWDVPGRAEAVIDLARAFLDIPKKCLTKELCCKLISKKPYCIRSIPEEFQSEELVLQAVRAMRDVRDVTELVDYLPENVMTRNVHFEIMQRSSQYWRYYKVPKEFFDEEFCIEALFRHMERHDDFLPDEFRVSIAFWQHAVEKHPEIFRIVPKQYITADMCDFVVSKNGLMIKYVPDDKCTPGLMREAIDSGKFNFQDIELSVLTENDCLKKADKYSLPYIPHRWRTKNVVIKCFEDIDNSDDWNTIFTSYRAIPEKLLRDIDVLKALARTKSIAGMLSKEACETILDDPDADFICCRNVLQNNENASITLERYLDIMGTDLSCCKAVPKEARLSVIERCLEQRRADEQGMTPGM